MIHPFTVVPGMAVSSRAGEKEAVSYQPPPGDRDDAAARQPPGWYLDPIGQQALRWWDGAHWGQQTQPLPGRGPEPQLGYPQQPYNEYQRQRSFTPDPQGGTPPGQSQNQSHPQYPGTPYGQHRSPQAQSYSQQPGPPSGQHGRAPRTSWPQRHKVLTVLGGLVALIIIGSIASVADGGRSGSGVSTDYINGYQDGYYSWGSTQWAGLGNNPCDSALSIAYASGKPLDSNDPNDNNSADYNKGWSAGCDDGANQKASKYPEG